MINDWRQEVKNFKEQYSREEAIPEFIDNMLPIYYQDILEAAMRLQIMNNTVCCGQTVEDVLLQNIYTEYMEKFESKYEQMKLELEEE